MKKIIKGIVVSLIAVTLIFVGMGSAKAADNHLVSDEIEFGSALATIVAGDTITLTADFNVTHRIDINVSDITIDGAGHTLMPTFTKTDNSNNATLGISGDNVVIEDLTIDGVNGINLHGINIYVAQNTLLTDVTVSNNDRAGIVVNGSTVEVHNITTSGNGWGGINVDQGGGVTEPAILTVTGVSHHDETTHIWEDDYTKEDVDVVDVVDVEHQYTYEDFGNIRVYTFDMNRCKKNGWVSFGDIAFKNQGYCVSYVKSNDRAGKRD